MENYTEDLSKELKELCHLFRITYDPYFERRILQQVIAKVKEMRCEAR